MKAFLTVIVTLGAVWIVLHSAAAGPETDGTGNRVVEQAHGSSERSLQTASDVEKLWPSEPNAYFQAAEKLAKILEKGALFDLFERVVQKECPTNNSQATDCFRHKQKTIIYCMNLEEVRNDKRRLLAIGRFLGEVRARRIPNYEISGTRWPGQEILTQAGVMEVSSLTNSLLKKAYQRAVDENDRLLRMNDLQLELWQVDGIITHSLLGAALSLSGRDEEFISKMAATAHLTEEEVRRLHTGETGFFPVAPRPRWRGYQSAHPK